MASDWIKQLKAKEDKEAARTETETQLRLHKAKVVAAKSPAFWSDLLDSLEGFCDELRATFPNDVRRHCILARHGDNCDLIAQSSMRTIRLSLNVDGQSIDKEDFDGAMPRRSHRTAISLSVDSKETMHATFGQFNFASPEGLAEKLVKNACDIYS